MKQGAFHESLPRLHRTDIINVIIEVYLHLCVEDVLVNFSKSDMALQNLIRNMLDSSEYLEQNQDFVSAYGKLKDDGFSEPEVIHTFAEALKEAGEDNEAFGKICKELAEQGENHRLVKFAGF